MTNAEVAAAMLAAYCTMKTTICRTNNGPVDAEPILHVQPVDGQSQAIGLRLDIHPHPADALPTALLEARVRFGRLDSVAFLTDAYVKSQAADDVTIPERGEFAREFAEHPDTDVREMLSCLWRTADGDHGGISVTYHFDGPVPIFDAPDATGFPDGNVPEILKLAFF